MACFSLLGLGLVTFTDQLTKQAIAENERMALLRSLRDVLPDSLYDNDIVNDTLQVSDSSLGSQKPVTVYRARKAHQPVAAVLTSIAPDAYNGNIILLVAILENGNIAGVRVVSHQETPGLGDSIEVDRSDWILAFNQQSLTSLSEQQWAVKRDGGSFDQFTGATITPRAVVNAVKNTLHYFRNNKLSLFRLKNTSGNNN